jgi:DHA2 family multidrug resistance protein-like MFS transporter
MQVGGALGVGVLGTALNLRYEHLMAAAVGHAGVPGSIRALIESSVGAALAVATHVPGKLGDELALVARRSFISGMDLALVVAACVVGVAAILVVALLPNWGTEVSEDGTAERQASQSGDGRSP